MENRSNIMFSMENHGKSTFFIVCINFPLIFHGKSWKKSVLKTFSRWKKRSVVFPWKGKPFPEKHPSCS
jgi:hypothetical protein